MGRRFDPDRAHDNLLTFIEFTWVFRVGFNRVIEC